VFVRPVVLLPSNSRFGESIELRRPDGGRITTRFNGFGHLPATSQQKCFLLPAALHLEDVPNGTEIWSVD
jgi:hypothetical protein